jgi:Uma2 family endonuclease
MAEPARKPMSIEDFLAWDDGTDRRYELVNGEIVAMAPPSDAHGTVTANLILAVGRRIKPPCRVVTEAGVQPSDRDNAYYQADVVVTCTAAKGTRPVPDPVVIIEVLSPSTAGHDRGVKVPDYQELASVQDILLVSSTDRRIQHWRRAGEEWVVKMVHGEPVTLGSIGVSLTIDEIYEGAGLD